MSQSTDHTKHKENAEEQRVEREEKLLSRDEARENGTFEWIYAVGNYQREDWENGNFIGDDLSHIVSSSEMRKRERHK